MNNKPTACLWRFFGVAVLAATAVTLNPQKSCAQDLPQPQKLMSPEFKESVLKRLDELLIENYVSPRTAAAMSDRLKDRMAHGDFDKITDEREFAFALTENMNSVAHDEHLHVNVGSLPCSVHLLAIRRNKLEMKPVKTFTFAGSNGSQEMWAT